MTDHTKEPWFTAETDDGFIEITNDERAVKELISIAEIQTGFSGQIGIEQEANARRIVACVNACAGLDTSLLENMQMLGDTIKQRFKVLTDSESELQKQRDKLLAALENILAITNDSQGVAGYHLNGDIADWDSFQEIADAEAAIAEAKGESK